MADAPELHKVEVELTVTDEDAEQLRFALDLEPQGDIDPFLRSVAQTASEMLLDELLGRGDYPTKTAARQTRLFKLVTHAFGNTLPSAAVVASLFHITPQAAATLIASTSARYARPLVEATANAVRGAITSQLKLRNPGKTVDENVYWFHCADTGVIRSIKTALAASPEPVHPLIRDSSATNVYDVHASAVDVIAQAFGITRDDMLTPETRARIRKQKKS